MSVLGFFSPEQENGYLSNWYLCEFTYGRYTYSSAEQFMMAQKAFKGNYDNATIKKWLTTFFRRFFTQQFKRSCMPDGPQTGACTLSPHGGWEMASDTSYRLWIEECEQL